MIIESTCLPKSIIDGGKYKLVNGTLTMNQSVNIIRRLEENRIRYKLMALTDKEFQFGTDDLNKLSTIHGIYIHSEDMEKYETVVKPIGLDWDEIDWTDESGSIAFEEHEKEMTNKLKNNVNINFH